MNGPLVLSALRCRLLGVGGLNGLDGRSSFGWSLLMAFRLIEAGVPLVQVNLGNNETWDTHGDIFPRMRDKPPRRTGSSAPSSTTWSGTACLIPR